MKTSGERKRLLTGLLFISPWMIGFSVFIVYPAVASLVYSFCDYDVLSTPVWVGALNYTDLATDEVFWLSLKNTLVFNLLALPAGLLLALAVALLLNQPVRARGFFRAIYYMPSLVPVVAGSMIWMWIFNGRLGLLNQLLERIGVDNPPQWLTDPVWTKPALAIMAAWGCGNTVLIFLASLQGVPRGLHEAAMIDGASAWQRLVHITIPAISPVIYFNLIVGLIGGLQIFVPALVMFGGVGPARSVQFYALYLYQNAFEFRQMGYASAMAWILLLITLALTWLATRSTRGFVHYT